MATRKIDLKVFSWVVVMFLALNVVSQGLDARAWTREGNTVFR